MQGTPGFTSYGSNLRPGITIEYESGINLLGTALGVRVRAHNGDDSRITVAAHGCPDLNDIHHPRVQGGRIIRKAVMYVGDTDIGLIRLTDHVAHQNEPGNQFQPTGTRLRQIVDTPDRDEFVEFDSAYDGHVMGAIARVEYQRIAREGVDERMGDLYEWIKMIWLPTFRSDSVLLAPTNGTCGTPITLVKDNFYDHLVSCFWIP
ncbi:MAG: hypothetical protein LQ340_000904 [Diploschistes diacapsis]|nr:MAG: hypothetical protein LQ340_000904 [Diploschistes diacapsis]